MTNLNPLLLEGGVYKDDRGSVLYINGFDFKNVKRFYLISSNKIGQFRGWHGHKKEAKYVFVSSGKARVGLVKIDNWVKPSREAKVHVYELDANNPSILFVPAGFANGSISKTKDTRIIFYSTLALADSKKDDIRFPEEYWKLNEK